VVAYQWGALLSCTSCGIDYWANMYRLGLNTGFLLVFKLYGFAYI